MLSASHRSPAIAPMRSPGCHLQLGGDGIERLCPGRGAQLAVLAHPGPVEPAALQSVDGEAGFVAEPFLVHVFIDPRQDAQHLGAAGIDADVRADRVQHVDAVDLRQFP